MKKKDFLAVLDDARKRGLPFTAGIKVTGSVAPEYIINPTVNLLKKRDYYDAAYDDNMELRASPGVKVVSATVGVVRL